MTDYPLYNTTSLVLSGMAIVVLLVVSLHFVNLAQKNKNSEEKRILLGYTAALFGFLGSRMFFVFLKLNFSGNFRGTTFYGNYLLENLFIEMLYKAANISWVIGVIFLYFLGDILLKRKRYFLILINVAFIISIIVLPYEYAVLAIFGSILFNVPIILIILFILAKRSRVEIQAISMLMIFGFLLAILGVFLDTGYSKELEIMPLESAPLFIILGFLIFAAPTLIKPQYFKQTIIYWSIICIFFIGLTLYMWLFFIIFFNVMAISTLIFSLCFGAILLVFTFYTIYQTLKIIKLQKTGKLIEDSPDILSMFVRPQKLTEEEVSISKEKKICLVCKGKVSGFETFLCLECETFYCHKCVRALIEMENMCWACSAPIDKSKSVKPFKKEGEIDIKISKKPKKK